MKAMEFFQMGGTFYMFVITISGILTLFFTMKTVINYFVKKAFVRQGLDMILLFGSLSVVIGLMAQVIGMYQAFGAIYAAGDISPSLMAAGFQISLITPIYGSFYFVFSLLAWGILREIYKRQTENN